MSEMESMLWPVLGSAAAFQATFWISMSVAPLCFSHYRVLDNSKGEKAYWAATFTGVLHAVLIVALCVVALVDCPELLSTSNFFQATALSQLCCKVFIGYILQDFFLSIYYWSTWPGWEANLIHHVMVLIVWWQLTAGGYAQGPATVSMLCESSTPFVALRWYLDKAGMKTGALAGRRCRAADMSEAFVRPWPRLEVWLNQRGRFCG
ncbi:unnamed protein product [Effrenium voratum]|nr:unnamed protein product [Effrenium voratum]